MTNDYTEFKVQVNKELFSNNERVVVRELARIMDDVLDQRRKECKNDYEVIPSFMFSIIQLVGKTLPKYSGKKGLKLIEKSLQHNKIKYEALEKLVDEVQA